MKKIVAKCIIFAFLMIIVSAAMQALSPVVSNELAMTQMTNSNELYMVMETYNKIKPIVNIIYICVFGLFGYSIGRDIRKIVNTKEQ